MRSAKFRALATDFLAVANLTTVESGCSANSGWSGAQLGFEKAPATRVTGHSESAGINRHVVGDARALQGRKSLPLRGARVLRSSCRSLSSSASELRRTSRGSRTWNEVKMQGGSGGNLMRRAAICSLLVSLVTACSIHAQSKLSAKWEELTAAEFRDAIQLSKGTCLLPFGILGKHGPHLPLGTDLLNVRHASLLAAQQEYAVVFPQYYFGQIFEAKHEPGTVAYSMELQLKLLQETASEIARNGCTKILIVNGHGANEHLLPLLAHAQLDRPHNYVVYVLDGERSRPGAPPKKSTGIHYP